ncbi:hypothetical protein J2S19_004035 [Metabacillus malikii]|uniref:Uncharacterized protein n=2 Tax=Metabacillus malikii TaxID=1504265 RepID=A0ABT9ZMG6_9BACI|nr:hypothetical protein [Metabacillus malikii]
MIVFLLIITSTALEISKEKQLLNDDSTSLIDYYRKYKPDNINQKQYLELENVKIFLEPREQLQLNVEIEIVNVGEERLSKLFFTLFHEFEVNKIETNGEKLNFLQNGDMVEIQLNHELEKGQRVSLSFDYDGLQTNLYFGNQQAVYLPSHFPWIPSINVAPAFDIVSNQNGLHRISHKYLKETKYQLTINYNNKIYTNLDKQGGNTWSGYSSSGVTVMSGMLNEKKYEDMTFIYPVTWEDAIHGFGKFEAYINRVYGDLSNGFTTLAVEKPKNIYFLPTTNISDSLIGESSFVDHGSLIIGIPIYVEPNRDYFNYFLAELTYELVPAYTTKDLAYEKQQYEFNSLFNHVYAQLINKQLSLDDDSDYLESFIEHKLTISSKVDSVLEELRAWLKTDEAYNSHHPVYEEWYNLVREGKGWDELNTLLKKHISM